MAYPQIPPYTGEIPLRSQGREELDQNTADLLSYIPPFVLAVNDAGDWMNTTAGEVEQNATDAESAAQSASDSADAASVSAQSASDNAERAESAIAALPEGTINDAVVAPDKAWSSEKIDGELDLKRSLSNDTYHMQRYDLAVNDTYSANSTTAVDIDLSAGPQVVIVGNSSLRTVNLTAPPSDRSILVIVYATGSAGLSFAQLPNAGYWSGGEVPEAGDYWTQYLLWWGGFGYWRGGVGMKR